MTTGTTDGENGPGATQRAVAYVIEDDAASQELVCAYLEDLGFQPEALEPSLKKIEKSIAEARAQDIVLIDVMLGPACDGFDVVRALADQRFAGRVIVMSGYRADYLKLVHSMADAFQLRIAGALEKPVRPAALRELLTATSI